MSNDSPKSYFSLIGSIFRRLKTKEKAIHKQLYLAMLIQVVVRLILYTDQFVSRKDQTVGSEGANQGETRGIDNTVGTTKSGLFSVLCIQGFLLVLLKRLHDRIFR